MSRRNSKTAVALSDRDDISFDGFNRKRSSKKDVFTYCWEIMKS